MDEAWPFSQQDPLFSMDGMPSLYEISPLICVIILVEIEYAG